MAQTIPIVPVDVAPVTDPQGSDPPTNPPPPNPSPTLQLSPNPNQTAEDPDDGDDSLSDIQPFYVSKSQPGEASSKNHLPVPGFLANPFTFSGYLFTPIVARYSPRVFPSISPSPLLGVGFLCNG